MSSQSDPRVDRAAVDESASSDDHATSGQAPERATEPLRAPAPSRRAGSTPAGGTHYVLPASRPVFGRAVFPGRSERTRSTLSVLSGESVPSSPILVPLLRTVQSTHPDEDLTVLERAFQVADAHHEGQKRKSGDPYITHPVAVTTILAELGMTGATLVAGLLHDTVEDTPYTLDELREEFGEEVAALSLIHI